MKIHDIAMAMRSQMTNQEEEIVERLVQLCLQGEQSVLSLATIGQLIVNATRRDIEAAPIYYGKEAA